eukprot:scaffold18583_cov160-Amphora_coffeaeformis.AAC.3
MEVVAQTGATLQEQFTLKSTRKKMESNDTSTQDHQENAVDFLQSMQDLDLDDDVAETTPDVVQASSPSTDEAATTAMPYTSRKPKWWHRLGPGKPTKGQKKAMQAMQATHQLSRLTYNTMYDWTSVFGQEESSSEEPTSSFPWVEIGCGTGENLLALAERYPTQKLIGAEMHASGIGNCFQRIYQATQRQRLFCGYLLYSEDLERELLKDPTTARAEGTNAEGDNHHTNYNDELLYSSHTVSHPYLNVRIFPGNGVKVLQASPDASLDAVLITFPDPFPKDASYRLLQQDVLDEIARVLRPGIGRLVVATDHDGHAAWAAAQVEEHKQHQHGYRKWTKLPLVSPALRAFYLPAVSKYEAKGWREGRTTKVLVYESVAAHNARENS